MLSAVGLGFSADARAVCVWNPYLTMVPVSGKESHGFDFNFSGVPTVGAECVAFTLHHYRVVLKQGGAPANQYDGIVFDGSTGAAVRALPHRAGRTYYARLYACDNLACDDVYGDAAGETISTDATMDEQEIDSTEDEEWLILGLTQTDYGIPAGGVDDAANDPEAFTIPTGWTGAGKVALFAYDHDGTDLSISVALSTATTWSNYNVATWADRTLIVGNHDSLTSYSAVSHPYVQPTVDGTDKIYRLLAQNQGGTGYNHVVWADSLNNNVFDFDLTDAGDCLGTTATEWP